MVDLHTLCMGCMGNNEGRDVCPHCGYEEAMRPQPEDCLPLRTLLQNRYLVGRLLERNGEGIGYIGYDTVSDGPVYPGVYAVPLVRKKSRDRLFARAPWLRSPFQGSEN